MCCHSSNFDSCTSVAQCMLVSSTVCRMSVKVLKQQGLLNAEGNVPERLHFATCAILFKINVYTSVNTDFSYSPIRSLQGSKDISTNHTQRRTSHVTPCTARSTSHLDRLVCHLVHGQHWRLASDSRSTCMCTDHSARVCALL
jgi:hypothetical protein